MGNLNEIALKMSQMAREKEPEAEQETVEPELLDESEEEGTVEAVTQEAEPTYTVKVNGEEREVTLEELRNGYMMQSDYSKKTAEIAEKRKQIETQEETIRSKLDEAEELIRFELDDLKSEEMLELKEYDPESYWKKVEKVNAKAEKFQKHKADKEAKMAEKRQKLMQEEQQKLLEKVPEWMDADRRASDAKELYEHLANLGFTPDEIASTSDHRLFLLARDALKLKKLNEQKPEAKRDKTPPKSAKPAASQTAEAVQSQKAKQLKAKFKKTGKLSDAYSYLTQR